MISKKATPVLQASAAALVLSSLASAEFFNASATYAWDRYRVTLYGRNLTDEVRTFDAPIATLFQRGSVEPGMSWGIEVGVNFGS